MVSGWRRTFRTSNTIPQNTQEPENCDYYYDNNNINSSPKIASTNFSSFFSSPSSIPTLHCRTNSPLSKHNNNNTRTPSPTKRNTPASFHQSTPSSPNSPSTFSLLKSTLRLSKGTCGICTRSVKTGEGKAIFTAECSHVFHFPCLAGHVKKQRMVTCPVCNANWKQVQQNADENKGNTELQTTRSLKVHNYNDDEPLMSPTSVSRFNPIPESSENEEEEDDVQNEEETNLNVSSTIRTKNIDVFFSPEAAVVASNWSSETYVAVLKVKSQPRNAAANRPPVDLVVVIHVGGSVSGEEYWMMKRSMQVVISSLGSADRLSVVAFSSGSKRLFPLRRMTGRGQMAARRVVDALSSVELRRDGTPARSDALKKAARILEDRRQKNAVAKIILLTNSHEDQRLSSTRFEIHSLRFSCDQHDNVFAKRVGNLLSVAAQDFKLELKLTPRSAAAEISAVYSLDKGCTEALLPESVALGDLYAAEEREILVEFKVPAGTASRGSHHRVISVRCTHRDPVTEELVNSRERELNVPRPHTVRSCDPRIERLRRCQVSARAVAGSRRLMARNDVSGALELLSSAQASVSRQQGDECLRWLEAEQAELRSQKLRSSGNNNYLEEKGERLTPMSAWRVAERLANVAIMRKSMNRVSDLHGFEDARF